MTQYIEQKNTRDLQSDLLNSCLEFSRLLELVGVRVAPYEEDSLAVLNALDSEVLRRVISQFNTSSRLFNEARRRGQDLRNTRQLTWWAVKELGLRPSSDFFDKIEDSDIVECYNEQQIQIFRSLSFYDFCSYDILSVLVRPWHELYGRDTQLHGKAFEEMVEVLGRNDSTLMFTLPPHRLWEVSSIEKREFRMLHKYRGPLFKVGSSRPNGIIMTSHVEHASK